MPFVRKKNPLSTWCLSALWSNMYGVSWNKFLGLLWDLIHLLSSGYGLTGAYQGVYKYWATWKTRNNVCFLREKNQDAYWTHMSDMLYTIILSRFAEGCDVNADGVWRGSFPEGDAPFSSSWVDGWGRQPDGDCLKILNQGAWKVVFAGTCSQRVCCWNFLPPGAFSV